VRVMVFEGDPKDIAEALKNLGGSAIALSDVSTAIQKEPENNEEDWDFVSTPFARKVLTRRALKDMPKKMLTEIYNTGDVGIHGNVLAKKLGYTPAQFRGMMGAFGRRLVNTTGYNGRDHFFGYEWAEDKGTYRYWLPETVREAVRLEVIERK
jgi:hypothetical protein